jgi:hypothetical protein
MHRHEGKYALRNILAGVRLQEQAERIGREGRLEAVMKHLGLCVAIVSFGACLGIAAEQQLGADGSALLRSLPRVTDLSSGYRPIGTFAGRGEFYAAGTPVHRVDDGEAYPNDFYPRMGRHHRDFSTPSNRLPAATDDQSLWYGEAAGKLIFIEYIFSQQDFAAGASWSYIPLNSVPIPPIDNFHVLHHNPAKPGAPGTFTTHMYFIPAETYLSWDEEPPAL